jgi:hypothetical protein
VSLPLRHFIGPEGVMGGVETVTMITASSIHPFYSCPEIQMTEKLTIIEMG